MSYLGVAYQAAGSLFYVSISIVMQNSKSSVIWSGGTFLSIRRLTSLLPEIMRDPGTCPQDLYFDK